MSEGIEGKVVVITGASSGLGEAGLSFQAEPFKPGMGIEFLCIVR